MTQATALDILKSGTNVFLTGEPGSGKTYLVNKYIKYLRVHGMTVAITASTGIAATHISGITIHSWAGIGIKKSVTKQDLHSLATHERLAKKIRGTHVLIIDEISMLDANTLDMVEQVCRTIRGSAAPFGGLQVVLVGDFFQLPPIRQPDQESARFAFEAAGWSEALFSVCYLTEQHRQSDAALSRVLADIRGGAITTHTTVHLATRRIAHHGEPGTVTKLYAHNANVDQVNADQLAQLKGETRTFAMTTHGAKTQVAGLIRGCLSPEQLTLKVGAAVMCTRNNPELGFVNGTLATVVDFDPAEGYPVIKTRPGQMITVAPMEWAIEDGEKITASLTQIPLRLAWAITIHKSQGMSLDAAVMDLSRSFTFGQGYVALSRVRTLAGLHLLGWNDQALMIDPAIQDQDVIMRTQSAAAEHAWESQTPVEQVRQQQEFIEASGGHLKSASSPQPGRSIEVDQSAYHDRLSKIRERYPLAYTAWTEKADQVLTEMYRGETSVKKISTELQRQPGAIRSRLKHLGLVA